MKQLLLLLTFFSAIPAYPQQPKLMLPVGHSTSVESAKFSADGKYVVTASYGMVKIWETNTGRLLGNLFHPADIQTVQFSPDTKYILTASGDNTTKIWETASGKLVKVLKGITRRDQIGNGGITISAAFSSNGHYILTCSNAINDMGIARIWETKTGRIVRDIRFDPNYHGSTIFSPNGRNVLTVSKILPGISINISQACIWNFLTGTLVKRFIQTDEAISSVAYNKDGSMIATTSEKSRTKIWDVKTGVLLPFFSNDTSEIESATFSPDGTKLITMSWEGDVYVHDVKKVSQGSVLKRTDRDLYFAQFSPDGKYIITVARDPSPELELAASIVEIWETETGQMIKSLQGYTGYINEISFSPDGKYFVTASGDKTAKIWETATGDFFIELQGHTSDINSAYFSSNGRNIVAYFPDSTMKVLSIENGNLVNDFQGNIFTSRSESQRIGGYVVTNSYDSTQKEIEKIGALAKAYADHAEISPDGKYLITVEGTWDSIAMIWDTHSGRLLKKLRGHTGVVTSAHFSPDNKSVLTVSSDNTVKIWETKTWKFLRELNGLGIYIQSAEFSPDGKKVITAARDNTVKTWDIATGKLFYTFFAIDSSDYIIQIPSGYYLSTKNAARIVHYVTNDLKVISFEQLDIKYNRPDLVLNALGSTDTSLIKSYRKAYEKRISKLGFDTTNFNKSFGRPQADFVNRDAIEDKQTNENLTLQIKGADKSYKLDRFNVWVNDVPVFGMQGISIKNRKANSVDTSLIITLSLGENRIETSVINVNGAESYRIPLFVKFTPAILKNEMAYFIGIGINNFADSNHSLKYSVKDIRDLADSLNKGGYIIIDTLFDKNVSDSNIKALKKKLLQTTENDKVIIAYSGHGLLSKDYDYYLSTYNVNFNQPDSGGLLYDDLENLLDSIPARKKLMLIDACHSGEVDKEELRRIAQVQKQLDSPKKEGGRTGRKDGVDEVIVIVDTANRRLGINNSFELMQSLFVNVGKSTGATIIAAAAGTQFAWEGDKWNHSVFTFSVLEAMTLHPALKVNELKRLVGQRVYELTGGLQKPVSRNETNNFDWEIFKNR